MTPPVLLKPEFLRGSYYKNLKKKNLFLWTVYSVGYVANVQDPL